MNPEFAEALLRVLNNNAERMAQHLADGRTVVLDPLPNPLDYQQGVSSPMDFPEMQTAGGPPPKLSDLLAREHQIEIEVKITLLAGDDYLNDATMRVIEDELNQHLAHALKSRGYGVLNIDEWRVEFQ